MSSEERQAKLEAFLMGIEQDSYLKATKGDNGPVLEARIAEPWSFVSSKKKLSLRLLKRARTLETSVFTAGE